MNVKNIIIYIALLLCIAYKASAQQKTLNLFSEDLKTAYPSIVYDFLERYLAEVSSATSGYSLNQKMSDDKFVICGGNINNIKKINPTVPFSMSRMEDKYYEVAWTDTTGVVLFDVLFPIQYELLLGKPKIEIEKEMNALLDSCSLTYKWDVIPDSIEEIEEGILCSKPIYHYYVESLNTASYYVIDKDEKKPLFDSNCKWYSVANLFQGIIQEQDYTLFIRQNVYGFKQLEYTVKLSQWLNYCKENNLTVYFAVEEEHEDGLKTLLVAQNKDLGYNHMLSIIIPDNFIEKRNVVLKAQLNAFIPTQNVKDLYQQYKKKNKKQI